ncbi:MAG: type II/IV secretion system ATPase subunit [Candidatus ainarchaeum sp.]|nr:type II/IV secretion system ATPase subunit [Candidatus ainarchaeum sp.]
MEQEEVIDQYSFNAEGLPVNIRVIQKGDFVPLYELTIPNLGEGTKIVLNTLKGELITEVRLEISELINPRLAVEVKRKFEEKARRLLEKRFLSLPEESKKVLTACLIQQMLGLGELEPPLHDDQLEEIVVNSSAEPVWVYHKVHGWCKTNIWIRTEEQIYEYAASIGRRIGKQITLLNPLMDANLPTGERVNATLFPVSVHGNTITIRKFAKNPWTISLLMEKKSISPEVAALIWVCFQNELSLLVSGGTASGKTSFLNSISAFIPPNQRIISIEDTRELTLPSFFQWIPMATREPNIEARGEVKMLDLMVNALRQRPDRLVVGEIRRQREAEVLFEAIHTGHSVYATVHADNSADTITRLVSPPINIPKQMIDALSAVVVQFRHRRLGIRRVLEFSEVLKGGDINVLYRWDLRSDSVKEVNEMSVLADTLELYAGMTRKEIGESVDEKAKILRWMFKNNVKTVDEVGLIIARYYASPDEMNSIVGKNSPFDINMFRRG